MEHMPKYESVSPAAANESYTAESLAQLNDVMETLANELVTHASRYARSESERAAQRETLRSLLESVHAERDKIDAVIEAAHADALAALEAGGEVSWPMENSVRREIHMKGGSGMSRPVLYGKKGAIALPLTLGDMAVAPLWQHNYKLDADVPAEYKRAYLEACAAHAKHELRDKVFALEEVCAEYNENTPTREAYLRMLERKDEPTGIVAERMVKSLFTKVCADADLGIEIEDVSLKDDVEDKIDFIIRIKEHTRAAGTTTHDAAQDIGVQFTINESATAKKQEQLARVARLERALGTSRVDSHVLVSLPLTDIERLHGEWHKADHRIPGGPETLWPIETKERVFRGVLAKLPEGLVDVDAEWNKARASMS